MLSIVIRRQETTGEEADFPVRNNRSKLKWLQHNFGVLCSSCTKKFVFLAVVFLCWMYTVSQGLPVGPVLLSPVDDMLS